MTKKIKINIKTKGKEFSRKKKCYLTKDLWTPDGGIVEDDVVTQCGERLRRYKYSKGRNRITLYSDDALKQPTKQDKEHPLSGSGYHTYMGIDVRCEQDITDIIEGKTKFEIKKAWASGDPWEFEGELTGIGLWKTSEGFLWNNRQADLYVI